MCLPNRVVAWTGEARSNVTSSTGVSAVDIDAAAQAVSLLVASGASKELAEDVGKGLIAAVVDRVRRVFGSDGRSVDALEQATSGVSLAATAELAAALRWYAHRDTEFAMELVGWAREASQFEVQHNVRAGRDAYTAGRDQTVIRHQRPNE